MKKVAVIGAGAITRRGHLPALSKLNNVEVSLVELDPKLLLGVQEEFGIQEGYSDYRRVLDDPNVKVVAVCTPTTTHSSLIIQAINCGKHVLVEKPLAMDLEQAIEIYRAARANNSTVGVVQNYRYFSSVRRARERLQEGSIGHLVSIHGISLTRFPNSWTRGKWLYNPRGALTDFTPHLIDLIRWMNDAPLERVIASGGDFFNGNTGFVTNAQALLSFANGTSVTLDTSWLTGTIMFGLEIHGTGGHLSLDVRGNSVHEVHGTVIPFHDIELAYRRISASLKAILKGEYFTGALAFYGPLWTDFISAIEQGTTPPVTIEDGVWVNSVIDAIYTSLQTGQPVEMRPFLLSKGLTEDECNQILQPHWKFFASDLLHPSPLPLPADISVDRSSIHAFPIERYR